MKGNALIRLRDLWQAHRIGWSLSYLLGAITLVCSVLLLAFSGWFISAAALAGIVLSPCLLAFGCSRPAPIEIYTIPTKIPEQLRAGNERMLAAMFPKGDDVWFFKVTGPEQAIDQIDDTFREFVAKIEFGDQGPDRFATAQ